MEFNICIQDKMWELLVSLLGNDFVLRNERNEERKAIKLRSREALNYDEESEEEMPERTDIQRKAEKRSTTSMNTRCKQKQVSNLQREENREKIRK